MDLCTIIHLAFSLILCAVVYFPNRKNVESSCRSVHSQHQEHGQRLSQTQSQMSQIIGQVIKPSYFIHHRVYICETGSYLTCRLLCFLLSSVLPWTLQYLVTQEGQLTSITYKHSFYSRHQTAQKHMHGL